MCSHGDLDWWDVMISTSSITLVPDLYLSYLNILLFIDRRYAAAAVPSLVTHNVKILFSVIIIWLILIAPINSNTFFMHMLWTFSEFCMLVSVLFVIDRRYAVHLSIRYTVIILTVSYIGFLLMQLLILLVPFKHMLGSFAECCI